MSQAALLAAAQTATLDPQVPPATRALIQELIDEVEELTGTNARLQQEAAEGVAEQFAKQRVDHYRQRAIKAEDRLRELGETP